MGILHTHTLSYKLPWWFMRAWCMIISLKAGLWPLTPPVAKSSLVLPQRGHIRTVISPLLLSPQFVLSIAPHLLLTVTLCLLEISSQRFFPSHLTYAKRMHTKQRADKTYELLKHLSPRNSQLFFKLTCNFLSQRLLVLCWQTWWMNWT